jgi:AcrR family transcriptional regulator
MPPLASLSILAITGVMTIKPPRKRDALATKARILEAAMEAFSQASYGDTGIREIAAMAGTSSTLLLQYFGSKAGLYEAALNAAMPVATVLAQPRARFGKALAAALLKPGQAIRPPLMMAFAAGDSEAAEIAARVTEARAIAPMAEWLGPPDARARALQIAALATGLVTYTKHLPLQANTRKDLKLMSEWFARAVQRIVDGED